LRATYTAAVLLLCACEGESTLFIELPPHETARTLVVAVQTDSTLVLGATSLDAGDPGSGLVRLPVSELGSARLTALLFTEPLEELGLQQGDVARAGELEEGYVLPEPRDIYSANYLGGKADPWAKSTSLDSMISAFRVRGKAPKPNECLFFTERRFAVVSRDEPTFCVSLTTTVALAGFEDGYTYLVDREGIRPGFMLPAGRTGANRAAHLVRPTEVYFTGWDGSTLRGDPERAESLTELPRALAGERIDFLTGSNAGEPFELVGATYEGTILRYIGDSWSILRPSGGRTDWRRAVQLIEPGEAVAVGLSTGVLRIRGSTVTEERVEGEDLMSVALVPGLGLIAGSFGGDIFIEKNGVWSAFGDSPLALPVVQIAPFRGGFLAAGGAGVMVQYHPDVGYCPEVQTAHPIVKRMAVIGDAVVLLGDRASGTTTDSFISVLVPEG
jgi:hypothetical protein